MAVRFGMTGVRGTFEELTPEIALQLSLGFSTYIGGKKIILARDTRPSGLFLSEAVTAGLLSTGVTVHDYGICPTPIIQWIIRHRAYDGGIIISAAHNTFEWNSLIFLNSSGSYLSPIEVEEFFDLLHSGKFSKKKYNQVGKYYISQDYLKDYFKALNLKFKQQRGKKYKFFVDCSHGAAGSVLTNLQRSIHADITSLFAKSRYHHFKDPEPNLPNAETLATVVRETRCDGGFLLNSDATRILIVDERGRAHSEELTLPIFARIILEEEKSDIVTTYSTSQLLNQVAHDFRVKIFKTDVGPPSVIQKAIEMKAKVAGEGSGSITFTPFSYGYDAFLFIHRLVDFLNTQKITISDLTSQFDPPRIYKHTLFPPPYQIYSILGQLAGKFPSKTKLKDGFYVESEREWLCVRASSTRSMIRIVAEGSNMIEQIKRFEENIS